MRQRSVITSTRVRWGAETLATLVLFALTSVGCGSTTSDVPGDATSVRSDTVLGVVDGGWERILPWKPAVGDAVARLNALATSHILRKRLKRAPGGSPGTIYASVFGWRLNSGQPWMVRFHAEVGQGPAVLATCDGTVRLRFPQVLRLSIHDLTGELAKVLALTAQARRSPDGCNGEILQGGGKTDAHLNAMRDTVANLARNAFPGGPRTVAEASGWKAADQGE